MNDAECLICGASILRHLPRCPRADPLTRAMQIKAGEYKRNGGVVHIKLPASLQRLAGEK